MVLYNGLSFFSRILAMFTLIVFILVLAVLVLSHEFGHFIVARRNGITVEEFGFGFPPRLIGLRRIETAEGKKFQVIWRKKQLKETLAHHTGTIYSINLVPLGGFVRIKGENPEEEGASDPDSFMTKKIWQKAGVISAGVLMNILVAWVLLSIGFMVGMPEVSDKGGENSYLQIVQVLPDRPAAVSGLTSGDKILEVGNIKNPSVKDFQDYVTAHGNEEINFKIEQKDGQIIDKKIRPVLNTEVGKPGIGVALVNVAFEKYPWYQAVYEGIISTGEFITMIFVGFGILIRDLFTGGAPEGAVAGPVGIAVLTGEAARLGIAYLLQFTAILSLNLAVLNILPIPALDGGRLLFIIINKLRGRPVTPRFEQIIHTVGFVLLMFLVVLVTFNDLGTFSASFGSWWNNLFN